MAAQLEEDTHRDRDRLRNWRTSVLCGTFRSIRHPNIAMILYACASALVGAPMMFRSPADLHDAGFTGFHTIRDLWTSRFAPVPTARGVYLVVRSDSSPPEFLAVSPAGHFKGRDPTLPVEELRASWIAQSCTLYIGKAGGAKTSATLRTRLLTYLRHGQGRRAAHWGGRAIWQLADAPSLLVAWRVVTDGEPRELERALIAEFSEHFGQRPFANRAA